eukprot:2755672-Rhodomonas_salina.1
MRLSREAPSLSTSCRFIVALCVRTEGQELEGGGSEGEGFGRNLVKPRARRLESERFSEHRVASPCLLAPTVLAIGAEDASCTGFVKLLFQCRKRGRFGTRRRRACAQACSAPRHECVKQRSCRKHQISQRVMGLTARKDFFSENQLAACPSLSLSACHIMRLRLTLDLTMLDDPPAPRHSPELDPSPSLLSTSSNPAPPLSSPAHRRPGETIWYCAQAALVGSKILQIRPSCMCLISDFRYISGARGYFQSRSAKVVAGVKEGLVLREYPGT